MTAEIQKIVFPVLDKMLADPKAKNFLNHLIRSYLPITKVTKVEETPKGVFKCVLTMSELASVNDVLTGMETEEFKANFLRKVQSFDEGNGMESPIGKLIGNKQLGVTGKDTTTFMSYPAFQGFYGWVTNKALEGNAHINWLLTSMRRGLATDGREELPKTNFKKDPNKKQINNKKPQPKPEVIVGPATYTLGDLGVLQKLKNELKQKGQ